MEEKVLCLLTCTWEELICRISVLPCVGLTGKYWLEEGGFGNYPHQCNLSCLSDSPSLQTVTTPHLPSPSGSCERSPCCNNYARAPASFTGVCHMLGETPGVRRHGSCPSGDVRTMWVALWMEVRKAHFSFFSPTVWRLISCSVFLASHEEVPRKGNVSRRL